MYYFVSANVHTTYQLVVVLTVSPSEAVGPLEAKLSRAEGSEVSSEPEGNV